MFAALLQCLLAPGKNTRASDASVDEAATDVRTPQPPIGTRSRGNPLSYNHTPGTAPRTSSDPAQSALPGLPATTKAGKTRQRMTWNNDMNVNVMRCYFEATKLETITTQYRRELHRLFTQVYPELESTVSEQRLIDQRRVIINNKRLSDETIQAIKNEVRLKINQNTTSTSTTTLNEITTDNDHVEQPTESEDTDDQPNEQETLLQTSDTTPQHAEIDTEEIENELIKNVIYWKGIYPSNRPALPKLIFKKDTTSTIHKVNLVINKHISDIETLEDMNIYIFAAAMTTIQLNGQKLSINRNNSNNNGKPKWQVRLEKKIEKFRQDIGRLTQYNKGNRSKQVMKKLNHLLKLSKETPIELLDTLKQKLAVYSTRLKRYKESNERRKQNSLFNKNEKLFYKRINTGEEINIIPPTKEELTKFWKDLWSREKKHNEKAQWIQTEKENISGNIEPQSDNEVTANELYDVVRKTHNWKSPGIDGIHNFWYKKLTNLHPCLVKLINDVLKKPETMPQFLTEGKTYIKPKNKDTQNPSNYRPITCLPTMYKIITAIITRKIDKHLTTHDILTEEQKGCRKKSRGCKEQLIIDSVITKQAEKNQRNLKVCYIDYKKAFDSIPHTWLVKTLEIYKIDPVIINFLEKTMSTWRTRIHLRATQGQEITTEEICIKTGIFQGDALSALWFCLCLNPLSNALNRTSYGFNIKNGKNTEHTISHLLYMDDIKIYATDGNQLKELLKITETITKDTDMEFGINKCKVVHILRGKLQPNEEKEILNTEEVTNMEPDETYKYLGYDQNTSINHSQIKEQLKKKYTQRLNQVLKSKLTSRNLFKAINTYAIPVLTYSFGVLKWSETELEELNRLNRTKLTQYRKHHPKSCLQRVTINRNEGGRGLTDITTLHQGQIINLQKFFHSKTSQLHKAIVKADHNHTPLNLNQRECDESDPNLSLAKKKIEWSQKAIHGKHYAILQDPKLDKNLSYEWLVRGQLHPETEGFIISIQDGVIATKNYRKYILKEAIESDLCRRCGNARETIEHIISGCSALAGSEYVERHDTAAKIIHQEIGKFHHLITTTQPFYTYKPESILENNGYKLHWNRTLHTDKTVSHNRPDITLFCKQERITYLIDIAIPGDTNVIKKEQEKVTKYIPLAVEIKEVWKQNKVVVVPIVISTTGITSVNFIQNLNRIGIPSNIHSIIQKAIILKTANIVRKFIQ